MLLQAKYVVAKYYNEIDAVISEVDNSTVLDAGSDTVKKPFVYTKPDNTTGEITDFYKVEIQYDKVNKKIYITEYQLDKSGNYSVVGTAELTVDEYNSIKSTL